MVTKSSREMQKDREKIRPPFGGLKFYQGTHYLPLTNKKRKNEENGKEKFFKNYNKDAKKEKGI